MAFCTKCGAELPDGSKFCVKCGAPMETPEVAATTVVEPVVEETPIAESVVEVESVVEAEPVVEEAPVFEAAPVVEETPVFEAAPVVEATPVAAPVVEEKKPEANEEQPKKKGKGLAIALVTGIIALVGGIVALVVLLLLNGPDEVDLKNCVKITFEGYDTIGVASYDQSAIIQNVAKEILKAQGEEESSKNLTAAHKKLLATMTVDIEIPESLSNGDKVRVIFSYQKSFLEELDIELKNAEFDYTVEGLKELVEIDPFEFVTLTYNGTAPDGWAQVDNGADIGCISQVYFSLSDNYSLENGDVITLTIDPYYVEQAVKEGYKFTTTSKDYTVDGLDYYLTSLDDISDEMMEEILDIALEEVEYEYSWIDSYVEISNIKPEGTYYATYKYSNVSSNQLIVLYSLLATSTRDDFEPTKMYVPVTISSLRVDAENGLEGLYPNVLGEVTVEGQYYELPGYLSGYDFYVDIIEANSYDYDFVADKGTPDFSEPEEVEEETEDDTEAGAGDEDETSVDGEEETSVDGEEETSVDGESETSEESEDETSEDEEESTEEETV